MRVEGTLKPWPVHRTPIAASMWTRSCSSRPSPQSLPAAKLRTVCRSSMPCELSASVRHHLDDLGIPPDAFSGVRDSQGLSLNAEEALVTLTALTSRQRVRTLLVGHPQLLCVPLGVWLDFLTVYGMSREDFFALLVSSPDLFTRGSLFNAGNVIAYLQSLGLSPRTVVASIIAQNAEVLLRDVHSGLVPVVDFLRQGLGLDQVRVRDFVCRCPRVLSRDVVSELTPRVELLVAAGFDRGAAAQVLYSDGALLTGDLASVLEQRLAFLRGDCGFSQEQAMAVLRGCPEALSLTVANLSRKWRFLTERMGGGREEVLEYPQFLSKNLLLHIGPRYSYAIRRLRLALDAPLVRAPPCTKSPHVGALGVDSGSGRDGCGSSGGGGGLGACSAGLSLRMLLDGDDTQFLERVWAASGSAGSTGAGTGACSAGGVDGGVAEVEPLGCARDGGNATDAESLLADFRDFRTSWLEREGARWTGVRSVGVTGSW